METLEEFMGLISEAYWAIRNGGTEGQSPRVKLHNLQLAEARRDRPLQALLGRVRGDDFGSTPSP